MAECELVENCEPFYAKLANMPSTTRLMRGAYCKGQYPECARYKVYTVHGMEKVPADLYPSELDRAGQLIN